MLSRLFSGIFSETVDLQVVSVPEQMREVNEAELKGLVVSRITCVPCCNLEELDYVMVFTCPRHVTAPYRRGKIQDCGTATSC